MAQGVIGERRPSGSYPEGADFDRFVKRRQGWGRFWHSMYFGATMVGIICLIALLANISNNAFGYVAIQYKVEPSTLLPSSAAGDAASDLAKPVVRGADWDLEGQAACRPRTCIGGGEAASRAQPGAALSTGGGGGTQAPSCRKLDAARLHLQARRNHGPSSRAARERRPAAFTAG